MESDYGFLTLCPAADGLVEAHQMVRRMRNSIEPCYTPNNAIANEATQTEFLVGTAESLLVSSFALGPAAVRLSIYSF